MILKKKIKQAHGLVEKERDEKNKLLVKVTDLEKVIKQLQFKVELHSSIEKDISKRRSHTKRMNMVEFGMQTEDIARDDSIAPEVTQVSRIEEKTQIFEIEPQEIPLLNLESPNRNTEDEEVKEIVIEKIKEEEKCFQQKSERNEHLKLKKSRSIGKLLRAKLKNKLYRKPKKRNNSQSDILSERFNGSHPKYNQLLSLVETLSTENNLKKGKKGKHTNTMRKSNRASTPRDIGLDKNEPNLKSSKILKKKSTMSKEKLINKRFSKGTAAVRNGSKRRGTDFYNWKTHTKEKDKFWQDQVHRLMQETKNYKQLHFSQKQEMSKLKRQNEDLKRKYLIFKKKVKEIRETNSKMPKPQEYEYDVKVINQNMDRLTQSQESLFDSGSKQTTSQYREEPYSIFIRSSSSVQNVTVDIKDSKDGHSIGSSKMTSPIKSKRKKIKKKRQRLKKSDYLTRKRSTSRCNSAKKLNINDSMADCNAATIKNLSMSFAIK
ncbi:unnamed protein product [Moneuplotes crassus]|uniref:Uncharacterized protein n=1 Tax=Euplotes crassus TaxID=5936 RepID=A0AAD1U069_EUPCR|nr:unnamed protein product [Moneuplotes crassus]